jgi:uncharacterized protein (TIGR02147 family)
MAEKTDVDVRSYLDLNQYLKDVYQARKAADPKFSYEVWSKELGLSSKSYLRFAVIGQRKVSTELTTRLFENLQMSAIEREYFTLLVLYSQCSEAGQKQILGRKLTAILRCDLQSFAIEPSDAVLANPLYIVLRNFLSFSDVPRDTLNLAKIFGLDVTDMQIALHTLEMADLIYPENGEWKTRQKWITVSASPNHEALASYHRKSLAKAIEAQSLDPGCRSYLSCSFGLSHTDYNNLLVDLKQFSDQICAKYDSDTLYGKRIYQINFNLSPWTQPLSEPLVKQTLT